MGFAWKCFLGFLAAALWVVYEVFWARPERMRARLRRQGIGGPPRTTFFGNILDMKRIRAEEKGRKVNRHDYAAILFPFFDRWRKEYGSIFVYSMGNLESLYVSDAGLVREINNCKSLDLGKPAYLLFKPLFGNGILGSSGSTWAHQKKVIAREFFMDKVKGMVELVVEATKPVLESWETMVQCEGNTAEITVDRDLRSWSADVISRACFGSSYSEGKEIFEKLKALQVALAKNAAFLGIPGVRHLPTSNNREIWRLERESRELILKIVKKRQKERESEEDLLQSLLESSGDSCVGPDTMEDFIVDNCKNIYFAGHEATATSAAWCLMLLASHPEWQARARDEVVVICGDQNPTADMLGKMKVLTMVIQETLRLYPPAIFATREALKDMKLGGIHIPKGLAIRILTSRLQTDPEIWGPDAYEFNPERFANGISGACKHPHAYIPYGVGPRTCLGQNLAMVELKIILSLILSKFSFSLSPKYCHSPVHRLVLDQEFGVPLIMNKA
ncbi:hypothetical protein Taro_024247 [Colocasia esculenta]|uniref:Uncharacterized protein n=1 Tax=Colocasia esculenta TaxID=4460 RepID=A0A843V6X5_COLES|nr:hypothetical protein [Colocasia esculenta]